MKEQKVWDLFALLAVGLLVLGVFWVNNTGNVIGKILIILGVTSLLYVLLGATAPIRSTHINVRTAARL